MVTLAHDWRCPNCGLDIHEPRRVSAVTHLCPINNDGTRRIYAIERALRPVADDWPAPAGGAVQLTLEGAT